MSERDKLYAVPRRHIVDFAFDQQVTNAFADMIRRSVPGYETVISLLSLIASNYYKPETRIYDLGCSLGAATLAMYGQIGNRCVEYIAVDNSAPMITKCYANLLKVIPEPVVNCIQNDIRDVSIENASVVVMNFTLQFLSVDHREKMLEGIYDGLVPGGVLVLSEKVIHSDGETDHQLVGLFEKFKAANGYSDLEISQKRSALEKVMVLDSTETHVERLQEAGFTEVTQWFQCFNFASLFAVKPV